MFRKIFFSFLLFMGTTVVFGQLANDTLNQKDAKGRKQGQWIKYNDSGMLKYKGQFVDDLPVGNFEYYFPDGVVQARSVFSENGNFTETTVYHHNGNVMTEGFYRGKVKDSLWKYYDKEHVFLKEEFYRETKNDGPWKVFYKNGLVAEEVQWKDGKRNGTWKQFFENGKVKVEGYFENDEKEGAVVYYFSNGRTNITGQYDNSMRIGEWIYMNEDSKVVRIETYEGGKMVKAKDYGKEKDKDK